MFGQIAKLLPLPVVQAILDIEQTLVSPAVGQRLVHAASFVTPFQL